MEDRRPAKAFCPDMMTSDYFFVTFAVIFSLLSGVRWR